MRVLVVGAGTCGLGTALLLARDGHEVTILERDADPLPDSPQQAWDTWSRKGVAQFRQPHNFMRGLRLLLEAELPDLQDAIRRAGASRLDFVNRCRPSSPISRPARSTTSCGPTRRGGRRASGCSRTPHATSRA